MSAQSCTYCSNLLAGRKNLRYCNYRGCQARMCCANCQREHHDGHLDALEVELTDGHVGRLSPAKPSGIGEGL